MKFLFAIIIFITINTNIFGQNAPNKIGQYIIGQTTKIDFIRINGYTGNYPNVISDDDEMRNAYESPSNDFFSTIEPLIYEIKTDYTKGLPKTKELKFSTDSLETFFIPTLNLETYGVNNVTLTFFKDTLVRLTYDGSGKVFDLLADKYKHKGMSPKVVESKSDCKFKIKGQLKKDKTTTYYFIDDSLNSFSMLSLITYYSASCDYNDYISVQIYDKQKMEQILKNSSNYFVKNADKKEKYLKQLNEKEKNNL